MSEFPIQIDATSLFCSSFSVPGVTPREVSSREVQEFPLVPGSFQFLFGSGMVADFTFSVTPEGKVDYDGSLDVIHPNGFLKGRGTPTLAIVGHAVTIDASQLTGGSVLLVGGDQIASQTVTLVPASSYRVQPGSGRVGSFNFQLTLDGKFAYDTTLDFSQGGFLKGQGSNTLTFLGYPAAVNATAVSSLLIIQGVFNFPDSHTGKADMVLLPANSYALQFKSGVVSDLFFNVELNGSISFDPSQSDSLKVTHEAGRPVLRVRPKNTRPARQGVVNTALRASSVLGRSLQVASGDLLFFDRAEQEGGSSVEKRDLALLVGRDNFFQSMQVMIETPFGSDIFNVNYGFDLLGVLATPQTVSFIKSLIRLNIVKSLSQDNRVREITEVVFDDEPRFVEILPDQNADENRRTRKVERRWQAVIVLQTISEGEVAMRLEGTGLKT
jgi:phage baseplate assembly protein W